MKAKRFIVISIILALCPTISFSQLTKASAEKDIIGTWIMQENITGDNMSATNNKMVFTKDKIFRQSINENLVRTRFYRITENSCGEYHVDNQLFLELRDTENNDIVCFELHNASLRYLSLIDPFNARVSFFLRELIPPTPPTPPTPPMPPPPPDPSRP